MKRASLADVTFRQVEVLPAHPENIEAASPNMRERNVRSYLREIAVTTGSARQTSDIPSKFSRVDLRRRKIPRRLEAERQEANPDLRKLDVTSTQSYEGPTPLLHTIGALARSSCRGLHGSRAAEPGSARRQRYRCRHEFPNRCVAWVMAAPARMQAATVATSARA